MGSARIVGIVGFCVSLCAAMAQTQEKNIELIPVNCDSLNQEIVRQRGKVVLLDFWASFCLPCRKAFPHFIEMHKKYAARGLIVITVAVDDPKKAEQVEAVRAFLRQMRSPCLNLHLQESPEIWTKKLDFVSLPCYFVFDRRGKWVRFGGTQAAVIDYEALEKSVVGMLDEK